MVPAVVNLSRFQKQIVAATVDLFLLPLVCCTSVWLRYEEFNLLLFKQYSWLIFSAPLISIPIFIRLGLYRAVIRFIDQNIVYIVALGVTISTVVMATFVAFATHMAGISRGVFLIYWVSAIMYVLASRFLARGFFLRPVFKNTAARAAIYGAGKAGMQLASAMRAGRSHDPFAFIDDKAELNGATIAGVRVYSPDYLPELIRKQGICEIFFAMPSLSKNQQKKLLEHLEPFKVKIRITPSIESLVNGELRLQDVRDIEIEDLLGRDAVKPNQSLLTASVSGKSVMVTGAGGSIGSELCRQIAQLQPKRLILFDISEFALYSIDMELRSLKRTLTVDFEIIPLLGSVLESEKCEKVLKTFSVETVYHAAAYKHVPLVEHNPIEGIRNNVFGTLRIAQASLSAGVETFVLISTDKVVRPTNVMGSTKRYAELILQALSKNSSGTRFCMVRFGNVLGSSGSVIPLFRRQIMAGGPITVTHPDITRYFMTIPEAAQLVLQAGGMSTGGDVFVLEMGEPVNITSLARRMVHLSGLELKSTSAPNGIDIHFTGLRPGEKMFEELMISNDIEGTEHPLIMRSHEVDLPWEYLQELLSELDSACSRFDCDNIRALLLKGIAGYAPQCEIQDLMWLANKSSEKVVPTRQVIDDDAKVKTLRVV